MIDVDALRGEIARNRLTMGAVADELHIAHQTFYRKMKRGKFDSDEMMILINLLKLRDPMAIFFVNK